MKLKTKRKLLIKTVIVISVIIGFMSNLGTVYNFYEDKIVPSWIYFSSWIKSEPSDMRRFRLVMADIKKYQSKLSNLNKKNEELWRQLDKLQDEEEFYESKLEQLKQEKEETISYRWILPDIIKEQRIRIIALGNNVYRLEFNLIGIKLLKEKNGRETITYNLADFSTMGGYFTFTGFYYHKEHGYYFLEGTQMRDLTSGKYPGYFSITLENRTGDIFIVWIYSHFTMEEGMERNTVVIITKDMTNNPLFPGIIETKVLTNKYNIPLIGSFQAFFSFFPELYSFQLDLLFKELTESAIFAFKSTGPETFEFLSEND